MEQERQALEIFIREMHQIEKFGELGVDGKFYWVIPQIYTKEDVERAEKTAKELTGVFKNEPAEGN